MRENVSVDGLGHGGQPIPLAAKVGGLLFTGGISGKAPHADAYPELLRDEAAQAFANLGMILEAAGMTSDQVAKVTVYTTDRAHREVINEAWTEMFPDATNRPVRHTVVAPLNNMRLQLEVIAVDDRDIGGDPDVLG